MITETIIVIAIVAAALSVAIAQIFKLRHVFVVQQGFAGMLYHKGEFLGVLNAGEHIRWGRKFTLTQVDLRQASITVAGQDVLTADSVGIKASLVITYQIIDPAKAVHETQNWYVDLYNAAQLALRKIVSGIAIETLLSQRVDLGPQLIALVQPLAANIGLAVHAVEVKDVMLPPDLKRAFAETLKAKQEGLAALERARGESAALRNLANAARVLEDNPALMNLRLVQSITAAQGAGPTLVFGMPAGFVPLKNGANAKRTPNTNE